MSNAPAIFNQAWANVAARIKAMLPQHGAQFVICTELIKKYDELPQITGDSTNHNSLKDFLTKGEFNG